MSAPDLDNNRGFLSWQPDDPSPPLGRGNKRHKTQEKRKDQQNRKAQRERGNYGEGEGELWELETKEQ